MEKRAQDRALATAVIRGEAGAAETLFERVFDALYRRVSRRLGGDHHAAEDVVHESLMAGLRALPQFRGEAGLDAWFQRIAERKVVDLKRRRALELVAGNDGELELLLGRARPPCTTPLERVADEEMRTIVRHALERLPERHRRILRWKYFEERAVVQVASRLSVSPKAAERQLARARAALAAALRRRGLGPQCASTTGVTETTG